MKKYIRILVILLCMVFLFGCSNNYGYRYQLIEKENGYFIRVESDEISVGGPDGNTAYITFQNFDEMRNDIQKGNFGEWEFWRLMSNIYVDYEEEGELPVCDLDKLYALAYPEGLPEPTVMWTGPDYWQSIESDYAFVTAYHSSAYNISREKEFMTMDYLLNNENIVITDMQEEADRNAKVCYYENRRGENKSVFYEIEKNNKTYYVCEDFYLWDDDYVEGVPRTIRIYFEEGDYAGYIYVTHLVERPSVEWLTSFDFYEYTGE